MNVPKDYDDAAERMSTHPLLLPKEDVPGTVPAADKTVLKKTNNKISFAKNVSFTQQKSLRTLVHRIPKTMSMPQQVTSPMLHRRIVLGDRNNQSFRTDKKGTAGGYPVSYLCRYIERKRLAAS